ncbi:MAG TPA: VCBS repeat-containing protein [Bryobacteraceae bacterium]|nr:VCBS repeat-containing protein [Bryobacteraceae bacterium]
MRRPAILIAVFCQLTWAATAIRLLDNRRDYPLPAGLSGLAVAAADLNGDGIGDVLTLTSQGVAVLLSESGTTNYAGPIVYPAGTNPVAMASADFNGDGIPDVATANFKGNDVTVLLAAAGGKLGAPVHLAAGSGPVAIAAADLDRDGKPDLVVADVTGSQIAILYGNGDGTFRAPALFSAGTQPGSLAVGDFNNDGRLDIAVVSQTGAITVLLGDGHGGFSPSPASASGASQTTSVTAADFNGDGILDIAVAEYAGSATGSVYVCSGKGDGTFQTPARISLPQYAPAVTSGDLNGDGHPDLIAVLSNQTAQYINALAVLLNDGQGNFGAPELDGSPETPISIAAVDLNRNGKLDVIVGCLPDVYSKRSYVSVVAGRGTGSLAEAPELTAGSYPLVDVADVNGDGHLDLVVADESSIWVALGNGRGGFARQPGVASNGQPENIAVRDVNGDGKPDVVTEVFNGKTNVLTVRLGKGGGRLGPPQSIAAIVNSGFAVGDLNGDGYADVVMSAVFSNMLRPYWGTSAGAFTVGAILNTTYTPSGEPQTVAIGDFNHDGRPDIAVSTLDQGSFHSYVEVFLGNGNGTFGNAILTAVPVNGALAVGDMDRDGLPDLVLTGLNNNTLQDSTGVLLSNGDGTFRAAAFVSSPYWTGALSVADFNGDGNPDVVVLPIGQQLVTYTGDGHGNLAAGAIYGAGVGAWTNLVAGDFLNDGRPGLAFGNSVAATVGVVQNISK